ncbi:MAG: FkbM family methyltransferase, partial [Anaerolineae bacterium]|nr:FkbM family methyltransferase [Anaerolineae bacterium]
MMSFTQIYDKFRQRKTTNFNKATKEDIRYCYRLFLNREPDEEGYDFYKGLIKQSNITTQYLVNSFLNGAEFKSIQDKLKTPTLVEMPKFDMYVRMNDMFIGAAIYHTHTYEPHVAHQIEALLKPGMTFVDAGANIGFFTMLAASLVQEEGQVFAFEPNPDNCELIRKSIEKNQFNNVHVYQNALAEAKQTFDFSVDISNGRLLHESHTNNELVNYEVQAITLDETLADLSQLDVIKMDIEGAEPRAWQGMVETIKKHRPIVIFEFAPSAIQLTSQVKPEEFLTTIQQNYDLFILQDS